VAGILTSELEADAFITECAKANTIDIIYRDSGTADLCHLLFQLDAMTTRSSLDATSHMMIQWLEAVFIERLYCLPHVGYRNFA